MRNASKGAGRSPVTLALLVGWVIVIVVGAGRRPKDAPLLGVQHGGTVLAIVMVVLALLGLALLIYLRPSPDRDAMPEHKRRQPWFFLAALMLLFWLWQPDFGGLSNAEPEVIPEGEEVGNPFGFDSEPAAESVAQLTDLLLVGLAMAVVAGIWFWSRRRLEEAAPPPLDHVDEEFQAELIVALDDASIELASSDDPRTGVLNAYLGLEQVLASHDRRRRPAETPTEHVRRAVEVLKIDPAPLMRLGELYSLARFSDEPITTDHQESAHLALEQARDELAAST